jgi:hypothetical protein
MGAPPAPDPGSTPGDDSNVVCTITKTGDGSYMVYAGDEPGDDSGDAGMSSDDIDAMGPSGDASAPKGQPADSVGAALKAAMDILQADASGGAGGGGAEAAFMSAGGAGAGGPPPPAPLRTRAPMPTRRGMAA